MKHAGINAKAPTVASQIHSPVNQWHQWLNCKLNSQINEVTNKTNTLEETKCMWLHENQLHLIYLVSFGT